MLLQDEPQLIICFHDTSTPHLAGRRTWVCVGLLRQVPVWLVPGEDPAVGRWLSLDLFPRQRVSRVRGELDTVARSR